MFYSSFFANLSARLFGGPARQVFHGMATLALGSGAARTIGAISLPILTRIYDPTAFGALSVFTALVALFVPIVTLRYVAAIPLPRHDGMAMNVLALSFALMLGMTILIVGGLWMFGTDILEWLSMEAMAPYWWLVGLGLLGTSSYEMLTMWATRRKAYKPIAQTQVFQSAIGSLTKIGLGLLTIKPLGLLIGQVVAQSGGISSLLTRFRQDFRDHAHFVTRRRIGFILVHYRGLPVYRLPSQFLLVFSAQAPILFTAAIYDADTTGQLGLALAALAIPMSLFGATMGSAYYAEVAALGRKSANDIQKITISVIKRLFLLALFPALFLYFFGQPVFVILFGTKWMLAGQLASILALYLLFQFVSSPIMQVLNVFNRQDVFFQLNIQRAIIVLCIFGYAIMHINNILDVMLIYSILLSAHYTFQIFRVLNCIKKNNEELCVSAAISDER